MNFSSLYETINSFLVSQDTQKITNSFLNIDYFPIFFSIQCLFICLAIRRHAKKLSWVKSLIFSMLMVHCGRIIAAFVCYRPNPLLQNTLYFPIFLVIWFLVNASPFDIVHKFFNFHPIFVLLQIIYAVIQTRQIINGIELAELQYPNSLTGITLISVVLSSTESFIFIITHQKSRDFSTAVLSRNMIAASSLVIHKNYSQYFDKIVKLSKGDLQLIILVCNIVIAIVNDIVYGLKSNKSIDVTFLTYFIRLFPYYGSDVEKSN